ncbi:hypothetical protein HGG75_14920 [Ochrobactrum pseudogrignonense]|nr:hypothetical protein [Brucella pseudogrignonensis]
MRSCHDRYCSGVFRSNFVNKPDVSPAGFGAGRSWGQHAISPPRAGALEPLPPLIQVVEAVEAVERTQPRHPVVSAGMVEAGHMPGAEVWVGRITARVTMVRRVRMVSEKAGSGHRAISAMTGKWRRRWRWRLSIATPIGTYSQYFQLYGWRRWWHRWKWCRWRDRLFSSIFPFSSYWDGTGGGGGAGGGGGGGGAGLYFTSSTQGYLPADQVAANISANITGAPAAMADTAVMEGLAKPERARIMPLAVTAVQAVMAVMAARAS